MADTFVGVQSPVFTSSAGRSEVVHFGVLGYGATNTLCLDAGVDSPDAISTRGSTLVDNPGVSYLTGKYLSTTDPYLAAGLSWYVRRNAPDSHWGDAVRAMNAMKSEDHADYLKVMAAYAELAADAGTWAGAYTVTPYLTAAGSPAKGAVNYIGAQSASGTWVAGKRVTVTLSGPATFVDGSTARTGTTTSGPLTWAWEGTGAVGKVTAAVRVTGLPATTYRVYLPDVKGRQRLAAAGPLSTVSGTASGAGLVPLTPARVLDTRTGVGAPRARPHARSTTTLQVTGRGGVPATAVAAVVLNVTVTNPTDHGYITAWPAGEARPTASNLNYVKGQVVANQVVAKVGAGGRINLYTLAATHLVADVTGYYPTGSGYHALLPSRLLDTRPGARPRARSTTTLKVTGRGAVPTSGAAAVVLNVTAVTPQAPGYVTVWPAGVARPTTSNLNYAKGQTVPAMVIAKVGAGGRVDLYTPASADLVVDVAGWIPSGGWYAPLLPSRVLDTRIGLGAPQGTVPAEGQVTVPITGRGGIPTAGVSAVEVNVTATGPEGSGFITAYPGGAARPLASTLNYAKGQTVANSTTLKIGPDGSITLYTLDATDLVVDVLGYDQTPLPTGQATRLRGGRR